MTPYLTRVLPFLALLICAVPAMAGQNTRKTNGFGDVVTADAFFPTRNLAAFGDDGTANESALVASTTAPPDNTAATLNAIVPAAGDAGPFREIYGPFRPGDVVKNAAQRR